MNINVVRKYINNFSSLAGGVIMIALPHWVECHGRNKVLPDGSCKDTIV